MVGSVFQHLLELGLLGVVLAEQVLTVPPAISLQLLRGNLVEAYQSVIRLVQLLNKLVTWRLGKIKPGAKGQPG